MPKYQISGKNTANFCWGIGFLLCKKLRNEGKKNIIMNALERVIRPFILITLVTYIAIGISVKNIYLVFSIFDLRFNFLFRFI